MNDRQKRLEVKMDLLSQIIEWANSSHSYLSERTDYARGYKAGITAAKARILEILNSEQ